MTYLKTIVVSTLTALTLSLSALAGTIEAKIDDIKVGATIKESIKLHGIFDSAPMPLPYGDWKVLFKDYGRAGNIELVRLFLSNEDPISPIKFLKLTVNPDTTQSGFKPEACNDTAMAYNNNFGTIASQFIRRCATVKYVENYAKVNSETQHTSSSILQQIIEKADSYRDSKDFVIINLSANKVNGRLSFYDFYVALPNESTKESFKSGNPTFDATKYFTDKTGESILPFLENSKTQLPTLTFN